MKSALGFCRGMVLVLSLFGSVVALARPVSVDGYNIITSPERIKKVVFPENAKLEGEPIFSSDYKSVLINFSKEAEGDVYYVNIETKDGVFKVRLDPTSSVSPQVVHIGGVRSDLPVSSEGNPNRLLIPVIATVVNGKVPKGYRETYPADVDYGAFDAIVERAWENGRFEIVVYHLVPKSNISLDIDPSQFYEKGVRAVSLSGKRIKQDASTKLIIVREVQSDG